MAHDDYALLIAIEAYPKFGAPPLKGPLNDLHIVKAWLVDPGGGNVPPNNIYEAASSLSPPDPNKPSPNRSEVDFCYNQILDLASKGHRLGRFYLYASGHGFSPARNQVSLFTAEANSNNWSNVNLTGFVVAFQERGSFREYVLWADCCLDKSRIQAGWDGHGPPLRDASEDLRSLVPTFSFIGHAALRPLKAIEKFIPEDQQVHGIFTWTLIEGLKGAAVDAYGRVTARSLGDWIRNAQVDRLDEKDKKDVVNSLEPDILREDAGLVLVRDLSRKTYRVRLSFPSAKESQPLSVRIWSGIPPQAREYTVKLDEHKVGDISLEVGLYLVEVAALGLRQGIGVTTPCSDDESIPIELQGEQVHSPLIENDNNRLFLLQLSADVSTEIFVIDPRFQLIERSISSLGIKLPFGLYKLKTRKMRTIHEQIILLDDDYDANKVWAQFSSVIMAVAPLPNSMAASIDQTAASAEHHFLRSQLGDQGNEAALTVMARVKFGDTEDSSLSTLKPWDGVRVVNQRGKLVLDLSQEGTRRESDGAFAACTMALEPGVYFLQQDLPDGMLEQSLILSEGWGLEVHILRYVDPETHQLNSGPSISILMQRLNQVSSNADDALMEACRLALVDEREFLNEKMKEKLFEENGNPLLALLGAHLLILDNKNRGSGLLELNTVVPDLRRQLGEGHPDVEAISLCCTEHSLQTGKNVSIPPMFELSWSLLIAADRTTSSLADRVVAKSSSRPYLLWSIDGNVKDKSINALAQAVYSTPSVTTKAPDVQTVSVAADAALPVDAALPMVASSLDPTSTAHEPSRVSSKEARLRAKKLQIPASLLAKLQKKYDEVESSQPGTTS